MGVSTHRWTSQGQKLGVSGHRGHQWLDAYDCCIESWTALACYLNQTLTHTNWRDTSLLQQL